MPAATATAGTPADPCSVLFRVHEVTLHAGDCLLEGSAGGAGLRVLCGRVEALSSDCPAALRAALSASPAARLLALSAAPLRA